LLETAIRTCSGLSHKQVVTAATVNADWNYLSEWATELTAIFFCMVTALETKK